MPLRTHNAAELALVVEAVVSARTDPRGVAGCSRSRRSGGRSTAAQGPAIEEPSPTPTTIAWAVKAASRRLPVAQTCLTEALAADVMLRRRGYDPDLRLGGQKTRNTTRNSWTVTRGCLRRCRRRW